MVRIDISNRALFVYGGLFILFLSVGFVIAYNSGGPPNVMGHSREEIEINVASGQSVRSGTQINLGDYGFNIDGEEPHILISANDHNMDSFDGNTEDATRCFFTKDSLLTFTITCEASTNCCGNWVDSSADWIAIQ